jgi:hypothetical protein
MTAVEFGALRASARRNLKRAVSLIPPARRLFAERDRLRQDVDMLRTACDAARSECDTLRAERDQLTAQYESLKSQRPDPASAPFCPIAPSACTHPADAPADLVAGDLARHRMALLRQALPADRSQALRPDAERRMLWNPGGIYAEVMAEADGVINMAVLLHVLDSPVLDVARAYFQRKCGTSDIIVTTVGLMLRKMAPHESIEVTSIPWHQDAFGYPPEFVAINCWTLLSPDECGLTAPGLDLIPDAIPAFIGLEATPASPSYGFLEARHDAIRRYTQAYDPWRPSIRLGDVLIFDSLAIHRTGVGPEQTQPRISLECRLVGRTQVALGHIAASPGPTPYYHLQGDQLTGPTHFKYAGEQRQLHFWGEGRWTVAR